MYEANDVLAGIFGRVIRETSALFNTLLPLFWYRQLNTPLRIPRPERVISPYSGDSDTHRKCARESGCFGWSAK